MEGELEMMSGRLKRGMLPKLTFLLTMTGSTALLTVLVADTPAIVRAVGATFGAPHVVSHHPFEAVVLGSGPREALADAIASADAVLVEWDLFQAPVIGSLSTRGRNERAPVVAVGDDAPVEHAPALAVGADRYHALPVDLDLLRAQVAAHRRAGTRRPPSRLPSWADGRPTEVGPLAVDWPAREARVAGDVLALTPRQFEVLAFFVAHHGEVLSREGVLEGVWGYSFDTGTNLVDVYVHHLRRRLTERGVANPFQAVRGRGYRFAGGTVAA